MLVMVTDYDRVTAVLAACAARFLAAHGGHVTDTLGPAAAGWGDPHTWVGGNPGTAILFFGHGNLMPLAYVAQDSTLFLDTPTVHLAGRLVCGVCCYSADHGATVVGVGTTVIGYRGKMSVNDSSPKYITLMSDGVNAGLDRLIAGATAADACEASRLAFEATARLLNKGSAADSIAAVSFRINAKAIDVVGNPARTLP